MRAPFSDRAQSIIDRLSERIDSQALRLGADAPHCVSTVGTFHAAAGRLERELQDGEPRPGSVRAARMIGALRWLRLCVASHAVMVADRAKFLASKGA